jgi:hypothetical protein
MLQILRTDGEGPAIRPNYGFLWYRWWRRSLKEEKDAAIFSIERMSMKLSAGF